MSMSLNVVGIAERDDRWHQMRKLWADCEAALVRPPEEVMAFFGYEVPGEDKHVEVKHEEFRDRGRSQEGLVVQVKDIPASVVALRFYASW